MKITDIRWYMSQGPNGPKVLQVHTETSQSNQALGYTGIFHGGWHDVRIDMEEPKREEIE